ncbi:MAG: MCE family protein [candidate division Zixibacteria bacterium]|nr:MCE family protein [candidate division Zixibacteria bacterium]NIR65256.1 MCE family protein [candidate division Zixibacteria bacterium]NIS14918.1 MCE family protein [candidate division Zixibacteria bacterium]NIS47000.1 MCE family protein [candidate division Zixibacteria bacterium]NIT51437.1 MCE family protein [candidate division Zixibacteria bacterium]
MAKKAVELKVGIVVIIGGILFVASILWLQGFQFRQEHKRIDVVFEEVGGLKKGDPVTVSGVNKGKVAEVNLERTGVMAELIIEADAFLHSDARFIVKNYGLMGERFVYIEPGKSGDPLDISKVQKGETDPGTAELIGLFGQTIEDVRDILGDIKSTVASEKNLKNLVNLASSLNDLSIKLNDFFLDNKGSIKKTFTNIEDATEKLSTIIDTTSIKFDSTLNNFASASMALNRLVDSIGIITSSISQFLQDIEEGKGTLGLLSSDETMYQDLKKTIRSVEAIIDDIRRNPKKYLNVEVEIF